MVIGLDVHHSKPAVKYHDPNVVQYFFESMVSEEFDILQKLNKVKPMKPTKEQWRQFDHATDCHICEISLKDDKVHDHCHVMR